MFLTEQDMIDLTGYIRFAKQCAFLDEVGYRYKKRRNGSPVVLQSEVSRLLLGGSLQPSTQPRFDKLAEGA